MAEKKFKEWFDKKAVKELSVRLSDAYSGFDATAFRRQAGRGLETMEMMNRVCHIANTMRAHLPQDVPRMLKVLTKSLPPTLGNDIDITNNYLLWPYGQLIADHCLDYPDEAMIAMVELTRRFTSEYAVRPFVERYPEKFFPRLKELACDDDIHVRRWCSEGTRPRLPWGKRLDALVEDPSSIFPILEILKDDPERYVQKSVANNLNDIARDHPDTVLKLSRRWMKKPTPEREWIVKHALRTLIKNGDPAALRILGFDDARGLRATLDVKPGYIRAGENVELKLVLTNDNASAVKVVIDFRVHYVKTSKKTSPTVFKWTTRRLEAGEQIELSKKLTFRDVSTRKLYPGRHRIDVQVNGSVLDESATTLKK